MQSSITTALPVDWQEARLIGRVDFGDGPTPVLIEHGELFDMSRVAPTVAMLIASGALDASAGVNLGAVDTLDIAADDATIRLLSPIDLQCVKAAGVTFAISAIERVIEERARGDQTRATALRERLEAWIGGSIRAVTPGSAEATTLKQALIDDGMWSQYLEVAIGPDAEIFTKSPVLSTVGHGMTVAVRSDSSWNNPEPEIVLLCDSNGRPVGATLGNDVNLRDFEGRSALLLGKAKDNNASCAMGPFVRLFDNRFTMDDVRDAEVTLRIEGADGYVLDGRSLMREISRDPDNLVAQAMSEHHYPDGFVLFLGTLFAPTQDRDEPGAGFTHKIGDVVTIASPRLGLLRNTVTTADRAPAWSAGIAELMVNLAERGLLTRSATA